MIEKRFVAGVEDMQAVEIVRGAEGCGGTIRLDIEAVGHNADQHCSRCDQAWWIKLPAGEKPLLLNLLVALKAW